MSATQKEFLDIKAELASVKATYDATPGVDRGHFLILGDKGCGKTTLFETCPKPVFIHSFDPGGCSVLKKGIDEGDIYVDAAPEFEDPAKPTAYLHWQKDFQRKLNSGFFDQIGTYGIDSATTMGECLAHQIMKKQGHLPPSDASVAFDPKTSGMTMPDWGDYLRYWSLISRRLGSLPCHTILTGHIERYSDSNTGEVVRGMHLPGQSKERVPILMHELLVLLQSKDGKTRSLLTTKNKDFQASTRIGGKGVFKPEEPADIQALLKKAGLPYEDKVGYK